MVVTEKFAVKKFIRIWGKWKPIHTDKKSTISNRRHKIKCA